MLKYLFYKSVYIKQAPLSPRLRPRIIIFIAIRLWPKGVKFINLVFVELRAISYYYLLFYFIGL